MLVAEDLENLPSCWVLYICAGLIFPLVSLLLLVACGKSIEYSYEIQ